jgi:hypothetical protein
MVIIPLVMGEWLKINLSVAGFAKMDRSGDNQSKTAVDTDII